MMYFGEALSRYRMHVLLSLLMIGGLYGSILKAMVKVWYDDPNYSHGFIVPFISGYLICQNRDALRRALVRPQNGGVFIILFGLLLLIAAYLGTEYFTMRSSLIVLLAGIVLFLFGAEVFRMLLFPLAYLIFMVPLPYIVYDALAFPLKLLVAKYSVLFLKAIGIIVWREGNIIMFPSTVLEVADACSGIRSLMSLLALAVAFAYVTQQSALQRMVIIVAAVPLALFANGTRVVVTGVLAQHWGARAAEGFFHEFAGILVFGLAVVLLIITGLLMRNFKW